MQPITRRNLMIGAVAATPALALPALAKGAAAPQSFTTRLRALADELSARPSLSDDRRAWVRVIRVIADAMDAEGLS